MTEQQPELIPPTNDATTPEEQAKRSEYRRRLAEYLKDPAFRAIEGFPIGTDEAILALSDPPYYTACPNPFIPEIMDGWQRERVQTRAALGLPAESTPREPFATDVSEGKNHPIYNAHSYHTKVPHKAIMRYILHYTDPGDIVFDGFCGTGMTGVAAQLCGDKKAVEELGYKVDKNGVVWEDKQAISRLGARKAVLNDLSPAATFIAYNYNTPVDAVAFEREARRILREVEAECGWMYETWHPNCEDPNRAKGRINYTVWSDVFVCPTCGREMVFWDVAMDHEKGELLGAWPCPGCSTLLAKSPHKGSGALRAERTWETHYDRELKQTTRRAKQVPALINYSVGKKRSEKQPDATDLELIQKIENSVIPYDVPTQPMMFKGAEWGDTWRSGVHAGLTQVHHFYTRRNLWVLASLKSKSQKLSGFNSSRWDDVFQSICGTLSSKLTRYNMGKRGNGPVSGTLYVASLNAESNVFSVMNGKISDFLYDSKTINRDSSLIECVSSEKTILIKESMDYIFVDPPFGENLMYSELNFIWEAWLKVFTNNKPEAIMNNIQHKGLVEYQGLMQRCFDEFSRVLKPGRWMTIEFHNSQNSVWNAIQEALQRAGFVIADVRVLDKQQETFKQSTTTAAVKQDLIISAYKPNGNLEENFRLKAGTEDGAWEFIRYHLGKLPIVNQIKSGLAVNAERQPYLLFDRMIAFHIQRGVFVPISAAEFYAGLDKHFTRSDGMYFLPEQLEEYQRAKRESGQPTQLPLFVSDEKSAIAWLRQQLDTETGGKPQTRGELTNAFNQVMHRAKHEKALELVEILEQNFVEDKEGNWNIPDHSKAADKEQLRLRALLREFKEYTQTTGRLRQFRTEAVRAGFADCFKRQDYATIVATAERLPEDVLREDADLLMYYDSALLRKK